MRAFSAAPALAAAVLACGCGRSPGETRAALRGPPDSLIPASALGTAIRRGRALLEATRDSLPAFVGNRLRCTSCHLDAGRRATGSWVGVYARYPQYRARSGTVETLEFRINDCFRRSMNGRPLPHDGPDMRDIVAYLWFLSRDVPVGRPPAAPARAGPWAALRPDTARGAAVYRAVCAKCHGADGAGTPAAPPVWGPSPTTSGPGWRGCARPPRSSATTCRSTGRACSPTNRRSTSRRS